MQRQQTSVMGFTNRPSHDGSAAAFILWLHSRQATMKKQKYVSQKHPYRVGGKYSMFSRSPEGAGVIRAGTAVSPKRWLSTPFWSK